MPRFFFRNVCNLVLNIKVYMQTKYSLICFTVENMSTVLKWLYNFVSLSTLPFRWVLTRGGKIKSEIQISLTALYCWYLALGCDWDFSIYRSFFRCFQSTVKLGYVEMLLCDCPEGKGLERFNEPCHLVNLLLLLNVCSEVWWFKWYAFHILRHLNTRSPAGGIVCQEG